MTDLSQRTKLLVGLGASVVGAIISYAIYKALFSNTKSIKVNAGGSKEMKEEIFDDEIEDTNHEISPPVQFGPILHSQSSMGCSDAIVEEVIQSCNVGLTNSAVSPMVVELTKQHLHRSNPETSLDEGNSIIELEKEIPCDSVVDQIEVCTVESPEIVAEQFFQSTHVDLTSNSVPSNVVDLTEQSMDSFSLSNSLDGVNTAVDLTKEIIRDSVEDIIVASSANTASSIPVVCLQDTVDILEDSYIVEIDIQPSKIAEELSSTALSHDESCEQIEDVILPSSAHVVLSTPKESKCSITDKHGDTDASIDKLPADIQECEIVEDVLNHSINKSHAATTTDSGIGLTNSCKRDSDASEKQPEDSSVMKNCADTVDFEKIEVMSSESSVMDEGATGNGNDVKSKKVVQKKIVHTFLLSETLCGLFIGKSGRNISALKYDTNTNIKVGREPVMSTFRYCTVEGLVKNVNKALKIIRKHYPDIDTTSAAQLVPSGIPDSMTISGDRMQLHLPMGVLSDVGISHIVNAGHVFVQLPTHPSFNSWQRFDDHMNQCYDDGSQAPPLPPGVEDSILCVARIDSHWHRTQIMSFGEDRVMCEVRLMDQGGYSQAETHLLRQIRADFLRLPFQAVECYLANIQPVDGPTYTEEADAALRELTCNQIVQCQPVAAAHNNIPFIHIIAVKNQQVVVVNRELADKSLVKWYELSQ